MLIKINTRNVGSPPSTSYCQKWPFKKKLWEPLLNRLQKSYTDLEKNNQCLDYESTAAREDYSDDEGGDTCITTPNIVTPEGFLGLSEFHSSSLSNRRRTNSGSQSEDEGGGGGDAHVCGKCRAEFVDLAEFLHHKKVCTRKRIVLVPEDDDNDEQVSFCEDSRILENSSFMDRSLGMVYDKDMENNNLVRSSDKSENSSDSKDFEYMDRKSSDDSMDVDSNENMKMNLIPHLPHFPTSISHVLPDTNVKIEALENTTVAVAQFANNNFLPSDLATLQSTLYSLQQQQLFQLQLIQQLQHHLMSGTMPHNNSGLHYPSSNPPNMIMSPQTSESGTNTQAPSPVVSTASNSFGGLGSFDMIQQSQAGTPPITQGTSPFNSASDMLRFRKGKPPNVTTFENKPPNEDPFFKHRCRYCGKVFGSDSALQIHIRSHTGERPFKCNVCGNRFSTKGNLKVHFSRHKVKYPHVRMNPHPIPEHLDKPSPSAPEQPSYSNTPVNHGIGSVTTSEISSVPVTSLNSLIPTPPIQQLSSHPSSHPQPSNSHSTHSHLSHSHSSHSTHSHSTHPHSTHPHSSHPHSTHHHTSLSQSLHPQPLLSQSSHIHPVPLPLPLPVSHPSTLNQLSLNQSSLNQSSLNQSSLNQSSLNQSSLNQSSLNQSSPLISQPSLDTRSSHIMPGTPDTVSSPLNPCSVPNHGSPRIDLNNLEHSSPHVIETPTSVSTITTSGSAPPIPLPPTNNSVISTSAIVSPTQAENYFTSLIPKSGNLDNSWESLMEVTKTSETSKLQQLVDNIEHKLTDPNQCVICQRVLSCKSALQMHYRTHTGERPFKCKICGRAFTTKGNLRTHMGVHRSKPPMRLLHQCNVCHKKFTNALVLQQHIKLHTGEPTEMNPEQIQAAEVNDYPHSEMATSGYSSSGEGSNNNVIKTELKPDVQKLSLVPNVPTTTTTIVSTFSTSLAALENHVKGIYTSVAQPISFAGRSIDQMCRPLIKSDTPRSQSPVHNRNGDRSPRLSSPPLSCTPSESSDGGPNSPGIKPEEPVNMSTSSMVSGSDGSNCAMDVDNGALDLTPRPMSAEGHALTSSRNTTCNICLKTFACYSALSIHYRSHTKERPFKCNVCDRGFSTKGNMKQHMLTHKIRDLPSQIFESTPKPELPALMFRTENISPADSGKPPMPEGGDPSMQIPRRPSSSKHVCQVCTKPFSSSSALQIHMRTHTGDKPFKCTICERAFTTKGNLKVHMGTHMWNNGSSRRGRRMSIESPLTLSHNGNEFLDGLRHSTEMYYPYASPAFMNGLAPKVNEISVIQSPPMNNGMFPPISLASSETMSLLKNNNDLELNLKKSPPPSSTSMSPVPPLTQAPSQPVDANKNASWVWKTTCNVCHKVCSSASALEDHIKVHVQGEGEKLTA